MNYGRKYSEQRRHLLTSKGRAVRRKIGALVLLAAVIILVGGIFLFGQKVYAYVKETMEDAPDISTIDATPSGYMSTVYDAAGNVTAQLVGTGSNRVYVTLDEIPENLQHAFVAIEDERFYEHNGVDLKGIVRAGLKGIASGSFSEGASTITQQLLKNNVFDGWTSETDSEKIQRKLQEQYLAVELEKQVSKDWIMENYLNTINLGQNTLGVEAAANRYFDKEVSDLNLSECAVIAAITKNPSKYNPISNPDKNKERRDLVLSNMLEQGYITQKQYETALADDVYSRINAANAAYESSVENITSYFVDALTDQVLEDLQTELGYSEAKATKALYSGGLSIYSTQDPEIQNICDDAVNDDSNYSTKQISFSYALTIQQTDGSLSNYDQQTMLTWLKENGIRSTINYKDEEAAAEAIAEYREALLEDGGTVIGESVTYTPQPQASMTIIDQSTGQVKAIVGGRGDKTASKTLNRATDTQTQPGSTFKILSTYAPALDEGIVSLATTVVDEPITYSSGKVINNSDGAYRGAVTIRSAIENSINVIAIKVSREVTLDKCYESVLNFGISTLSEDVDKVEALPIGGIGSGVTNLEMAAAYAAIANGGVYNEPVLYTKILDHDGNVLLEKTPETHRVIKESTAFLLTSAMEDVITSGTGRSANISGMSVAGKTGTTNETKASWLVGFSPYYTCAVWGGYDDNTEMSSSKFTKNLWRTAMEGIHEGLEDIGFTKPDSVKSCSICTLSGKLAVEGVCTDVRTEYVADTDDIPTETCDAHVQVTICTESGLLASEYCPAELCEIRTYDANSTDPETMAPTETCNVHVPATPLQDAAEQILDTLQGLTTPETQTDDATQGTATTP